MGVRIVSLDVLEHSSTIRIAVRGPEMIPENFDSDLSRHLLDLVEMLFRRLEGQMRIVDVNPEEQLLVGLLSS